MDLFISTFESVCVLLGLGFLGFLVISRRILPQKALGFLSPLALDIALPSLVFVNIISNFRPAEFTDWWTLPLWWLGFTFFAGTMTGALMFLSAKNSRREFALSLFFQNAFFFPFGIITGLYGAESTYLVSLFLFIMFFPSLFFSTYHLFFNNNGKKLRWERIINNVLIATLAATVIRLAGFNTYIPGFVLSALEMVGNMALPILMIILGGSIYVDFKDKGRLFPLEIAKFLLAKNILFPLATLGCLLLIKPQYDIALLILIESTVPPLTAVPIVVDKAGGNTSLVNQFMFTSFIFSVVSIPFFVSIFMACFSVSS